MGRGGYRPFSGPKKGTKYKTHSGKDVPKSKLTPEEKENIRLMMSFGERIMDGGKLTRTEIKQLEEMSFGELTRDEKRLLEEFQF